MNRMRVFVGSSTEARERGIVPRVVELLSTHFVSMPWYEQFAPGEYTLDALLALLNGTDLALFVFTADDRAESRGRTDAVTRDNVILEYGLFASHLGRRRVAVIQEEGVKLPVDVNGMTVVRFPGDGGPAQNAALELALSRLRKSWAQLDDPPPPRLVVDGGLGFAHTVRDSLDRLDAVRRVLWAYDRNRVGSQGPVSFDSRGSCVSTYAEALDRVTSRFWTTTYLSSGFWNQNNPLVLNSNRRMLERLAAGGDVRRLFLVQQPLRDEVAACREHHVLDRKLGRHASSSRRRLEFRHMKQNVEQMLLAGCRVRVAHDAAEAHRTLPGPMDFQANDSELAVYDNARVDVFEGGSAGRITGVRCFTPATRMFEAYLDQSVRYFEQLWESGRDITDFLRELEDAYESAEGRIDYESNWLAFYEFSLPHADATLKTVEIKRVEEILRGHHKWGQLRRCLDIGTCTGRYPLFLAEGLDSGGEVIGIDDDFDCVRFAAANVARQLPHEHRIRIEQVDFTSASGPLHGPFDVITCMLGTLSHFGRGRCQPFEPDASDDLLQACLKRMRTLLADDGLLVLGTWSDHARLTGQMLGIYRDSERQRLAEWTPPLHELRARLAAAGLTAVDTARPDLRLDLTVCRSAAAAAAAAQEAA